MSSLIHLAINGAIMETWICLIQRSCLSNFSHGLLRGQSQCMTNLLLWALFLFFFAKVLLFFLIFCVKSQTMCHLCSHIWLPSALLKSRLICMVFHSISNLWISYSMQGTCLAFSFLPCLIQSNSSSVFIYFFLLEMSIP